MGSHFPRTKLRFSAFQFSSRHVVDLSGKAQAVSLTSPENKNNKKTQGTQKQLLTSVTDSVCSLGFVLYIFPDSRF